MSDSESQENRPVKRWAPLEANPEVLNKIIHKVGIDQRYNFVDVYGFEPELLAMIPQPTEAIIFLFPITKEYEEYKDEQEARLTKLEQNINPDIVFFKQTIENSCGMIALLHSVASNNNGIVGPGLFHNIIEQAKDTSVDERNEILENCKELEQIHETAAIEGQTEAPGEQEDVDLHFICFIEIDKHLYELDGRKSFPINHGKCTNFVECAAEVMVEYMEINPENSNFSAIALCKTEE